MTNTGVADRRALRILVAFFLLGMLSATPWLFAWIQSLYPLGTRALPAIAEYVIASAVLTIVALCLGVAWIAPSWIIARHVSPTDKPMVRALRATVISFWLQPLLNAALVWSGASSTPDRARWFTILGQGGLLLVAALWPAPPRDRTPDGSGLWRRSLLVAFVACLTTILVGRIAWADFTNDGVELLTLGRSVASYAVPRFWNGNLPPTDIVMFMAAFPTGWLVTLGGVGEIAARLPAVGYGAGIAIGAIAVAEQQRLNPLSRGAVLAVLTGVAAVVLTVGLNAAYHPYSTDLASPATIDLLVLVFLMAVIYFAFDGSPAWAALSATLLALTRPTGLLLCGILAVAILLIERDWRSPRFRAAVVAVAATLAVGLIHAFARGGEGTLARMRYLRFDDWSRVRYLLIPTGAVPVLAWTRWRSLDDGSRILVLATLAYFGFFYCMASYSLHHFAPAMVLPLLAFWRTEIADTRWWRAAAGLGATTALVAALPTDWTVYRDTRRVAATMSYEIGDYLGDFAGLRSAIAGVRAMDSLFAPTSIDDPQRERISEVQSLVHYASVQTPTDDEPLYVVRSSGAPPAAGMSLIRDGNQGSVWVRDTIRWRADRANPPPPAPRSPLYNVPRSVLYSYRSRAHGLVQVDLLDVIRRVRAIVR